MIFNHSIYAIMKG